MCEITRQLSKISSRLRRPLGTGARTLIVLSLFFTTGAHATSVDWPCVQVNGRTLCPRLSTVERNSAQSVAQPIAGHHCEIRSAQLFCQGDNHYGQVGNGEDSVHVAEAVPVRGLPAPVTQVTLGRFHTCAIADGRAYCWGRNTYGQAGAGERGFAPMPVLVAGLPSPVQQISAGDDFTCALSGGGVWCWGSNLSRALGVEGMAFRRTPAPVAGLEREVSALGAAGGGGCALQRGALYCWGSFGNPRATIARPQKVSSGDKNIQSFALTPGRGTAFDGRCFIGIPAVPLPGSPWFKAARQNPRQILNLGCLER